MNLRHESMKTTIFSTKQIKKAAEIIRQGGLIAFPTETVYGLGANALDSEAVKKIFIAKGRPSDNPLIVHISNINDLKEIAKISESKKQLIQKVIKRFWPGPLTIVLRKTAKVPLETSGGLNTVAIRMPNNKIALDLIKYSGVPLAAPSANISGKPSGTSFSHVFDDFNGKIAGIIKSKSCEIGLESTVVDLTTKRPVLLRAGGMSLEELKTVMPDLKILLSSKTKIFKSPGMKYQHYSPEAKIILFENSAYEKIIPYAKKLKSQNKKIKIILSHKNKNLAKNLFKIFRQCDKESVDYILISSVEETGIGLALMNRIRKAASKIIS
jgi:L-threonylcarbamoyladenylate synthase